MSVPTLRSWTEVVRWWSVIFVLCAVLVQLCSAASRSKRFLLFPRASPPRIQLIAGVGLPVDLDLESLTVGYVFKAQYFLPYNATSFYNYLDEPFRPYPIPAEGRRRKRRDTLDTLQRTKNETDSSVIDKIDEHVERYSVEAKVIEDAEDLTHNNNNSIKHMENDETSSHWYDESNNDDDDDNENEYSLEDLKVQSSQNLDRSRFTLYKSIEKLAETSGVPGRPCLLRSICETAEAPFSYSNGILGELAHLIMTPSSSVDELSEHSDNEYLKAEELGQSGAPCEQIFHECPTSLLNKFSGIYETLNMFG